MDTISRILPPLVLKYFSKEAKRNTHIKQPKTGITNFRSSLKQLKLGNESSFLYLAYLTDTIGYVPGPGDAKNDPETKKHIRKTVKP